MADEDGSEQVALWVTKYGRPGYDLHETEDQAAYAGVAMQEAEAGAVLGVQFADGRVIDRDDWPAFEAAEHRWMEQELAIMALAAAKPTVRKARCPFTGKRVEILTEDPAWLGKKAGARRGA